MAKRNLYTVSAALFLVGCAPQNTAGVPTPNAPEASTIDISLFAADALLRTPQTVACTLESGSANQCLELAVKYRSSSLNIGPFCPATLNDTGGIWYWDGAGEGLYRVDKAFFDRLDALGYRFYDDNGDVHIADIAVAEPVDDHACINVSEDEDVEITALIPLNPVLAERPSRLGVVNKVGMALTGTPIFSDAPSIQRTGHMPALDTCGGHVDPGGWYHWHANSNDIKTVFSANNVTASCTLPQNASVLFGYAFDGFPIYGSLEANGAKPEKLDDCGGHAGLSADGTSVYHYHTSSDFPNLPNCLVGEVAVNNFSTTAQVGVGANPPEGTVITRGSPPRSERPGGDGAANGAPPGFAEAADKLGVTEDALFQAIRNAGGGPQQRPDIAQAAAELGVSSVDLEAALPSPPQRRPR